MDFKDAVKYLRSELGLTQMELANALNVNFATIGRWEKGQNLPNRSLSSALLDFARAKPVSDECLDILKRAIDNTAKKKWNGRSAQMRYEAQDDSGRLLQAIIENLNGGVSVVSYSEDGNVSLAYANERYYALMGYTKSEFLTDLNNPHKTIYPQDADYVASAIANVKKTRRPDTFRFRIVKRDNSVITVRCSLSTASIEGLGNNVLMSVITDITESVQAEQQAIISGQRLNAIMANINNGVVASILREDGAVDYVFVTDSYYEMLGFTREQYHAEVNDPFDLIYGADKDAVRAQASATSAVGDSAKLNYRAVRRDGRIIHLSVSIRMMSFADVESPVQLSVFTDVTHIVEANEKLAAQRDQINDMINSTPGGIAVIEVDTKDVTGSLHTTYYNDSFFSYSGYSREEYDRLLKANEMHFVFDEDVPALMEATVRMCSSDAKQPVDTTVRCHTKDGGYRWLLLTGQLAARHGDICVINIVMVDITNRKIAEDKQRISERMLRIAAETDKRTLVTYDVKSNTCHIESQNLFSAKLGEKLGNIPESLLERKIVAGESADELSAMFKSIRAGEKNVRTSLLLKSGDNEYQWYECNASVVLDADGMPDHAVLVFHNITEQRVKEAVFKKWQNSIQTRSADSFTLFRCNLSRDCSLDEQDGELLRVRYSSEAFSFNERTREYADKFVYAEDQKSYMATVDSDVLLSMFYRGEHSTQLEYREVDDNGELMWRKLTIEMVEYLNSTDIQAFLLYENIDEQKRAELKEKELAETDPLTGALNRVAFSERVDTLILSEAKSRHVLFMIDMDGFKQLNDTFGHAAGDQALIDITAILRSLVREGDLVCRLGGDEFLVWLCGIPYDAVIGKKARQICEQVQKAFSQHVRMSASIGIAVYPRDGGDFDELYANADKALYKTKRNDKGGYSFFSRSAHKDSQIDSVSEAEYTPEPVLVQKTMRKMLVADDDELSRLMLENMFKNEYSVELAKNGAEAIKKLRHFGSAISVVLLDLIMPGMDGFTVLKKMQESIDLRTIPAVVVSGDNDRRTLLKAIENGAADFVTKPIDADLIRFRVQSAVSKAENERLRAQNSYLQLQRDEELKYYTVLESTGTVVVEYNWRNHVFIYDNTISKHIYGNFDHRGLWQIFASDMVADSADIDELSNMLAALVGNNQGKHAQRLVMLKTPALEKHWFRVNIYKRYDIYGLAEKMIITFNDVHEEVLANEKLRFRATHDELTGLYSRAGFIEKAAELIASKEAGYFVMACVDIEKFKVINDQYGTDKGDEVLKKIADTLLEFYHADDTACCRVMADNFAVLYPKHYLGTPELYASHRYIEQLDGSLPRLMICIGRYIVDDKSLSISAIYDRAAMARDTVKGRFDAYVATYDESMRMSILRQQEITGQMKTALESGQFEVWLQPQFNHATGLLSGAEALVRWRHPVDGMIFPSEFIPIFERNGFIYELDKFVWEATCRLLRKWLDMGLKPLPVSVNISRYDVFRNDLVSVITDLVDKYALPGDILRLEITESAFSESTDQINKVVKRFVDLGFIVEIDDFGSGYSSLNTLKDVPAQVLKMDMRFLENDSNAQRGGSIIESVVRMAKWLGMSVIAEGVETVEQADYLKSIGCEHIQGYLYSRPIQTLDYEKLLSESKPELQRGKLQTVGTWNNNAFWNPKSIETLIFNSYVGGACIFEYRNGNTELLRYNDGYVEIFRHLLNNKHLFNRKDVAEELGAENGAIVKNSIEAAIKENKESACQITLHRDDGNITYVRITIRQIARAGDRYLFYCVVADVTAQHVAERSEMEAANRIAVIMDKAVCGITVIITNRDRENEVLLVNDKYYKLVGYTKEQYKAEVKEGIDLIHPLDAEQCKTEILKLNEVGQTGTFEFRLKRRDGRWIWLRDDIAVIALSGVSEPVRISCFTDITALKHADARLRFVSQLEKGRISPADADRVVSSALLNLNKHFCAQKSFVAELKREHGAFMITHEAPDSGAAVLKRVILLNEKAPWYMALARQEIFKFENAADIEDASLKDLASLQDACRLALVPLVFDGELTGFLGILDPVGMPDDVESIPVPVDYIAILLARRLN